MTTEHQPRTISNAEEQLRESKLLKKNETLKSKLVELHDRGLTIKQIAKELDTPWQTVGYWINTLGRHVVKVLLNPHLEMIEVNNKGDHSEIIHRNNKGDDHA